MAKVHKSLRLDAELVERVTAHKLPGETEVTAFALVLSAGCDHLEGCQVGENTVRTRADQAEHGGEHAENTQRNTPDPMGGTVEELRDHIETLKQTTAYMREQLKVKDEQIAVANRLADQAQILTGRAQELHAMSTETKALEEPVAEGRKTWREKWRAFWD